MTEVLIQYATLLDYLHRGGQFAHWWTPDSGKFYTDKKTGEQKQAKFSVWFPVGQRSAVPVAWRDKNVYFCVHPQTSIPQKVRPDGSVTDQKYIKAWVSHVAAINCFFAEYDVKDYGDKEAIYSHLRTLPLQPSVIIDSGGGLHCYWLLANTVTVTEDNREYLKRMQYAWVDLVGSDPDAKDLARVLRVPGTFNRKEKYAPNFPAVSIVQVDYQQLYSLEEFERLTQHLLQEEAPRVQRTGQRLMTDDLITAAESLRRLAPARCDQYSEWLGVGMALKGLGMAGLQLWDEWSRGSAKYNDGACADKWDKISADGLGLGSLVKWANDDDPSSRRIYTNGNENHKPKPAPGAGQSAELIDEPAQGGDTENLSPAEIDVLKYRSEDGGIRDAWVEHCSTQWIYAVGPDKWYHWQGAYWQQDDALLIHREIHDLMDAMNRQCSAIIKETPSVISALTQRFQGIEMPKEITEQVETMKKSMVAADAMRKSTKRSNGRIGSVEGMCRSVHAKSISAFDVCDSLNLKNGTLNLHSLELQPHSRDDFFTYQLDYEYDSNATCPLFERFISEVLVKEGTSETDPDLVMLFQELLGYSMTTQTKRQVMVWMFGEGGNGKSVAIDLIQALLGTMATSVDFQTLGTSGNYDLADVPGKRVLFSTEAEKGGAVAEKYIKCIVSGDPLKARPIYGSTINFRSMAKIWWAMNDRPIVRDTSDSMWRRMKLIPFYRKFEEGKNADVNLTPKLMAELPGILNWAIRGLMRLTINDRFTSSESADSAKSLYREESNPVARWVNTMTIRTEYPTTLQGALFDHFKSWLNSENEKSITSSQFGRDLGRLKIPKVRREKGVMYHLALLDDVNRGRHE